MGKIILIILGIYVLYYAGNIVYDLFLKKEKAVKSDENTQTILMEQFEDENAQNVDVDEVSEMKMPEKFNRDDFQFPKTENSEDLSPEELEKMRRRYEETAEIPQEKPQKPQENALKKAFSFSKEKMRQAGSAEYLKDFDLQGFINEAQTAVKCVANVNGEKTYEIT